MNNDLISRSALFKKIQPVDFLYGHDEDAPYSGMAVDACDVEAAPAVDAVEVGNCEGCMWKSRKRPQKCSCCRRNPDMKDCYEERKTE